MTMITVDDLARDLKVRNEDLLRQLVTMGYEVDGPESPLETDDPVALKDELVTVLPRKEVVEKRINRTVIRRRVKKKASAESRGPKPASAHDEGRTEGASAHPQRAEPPARSEPKPPKKAKRVEPARIIEKPAARPAPPDRAGEAGVAAGPVSEPQEEKVVAPPSPPEVDEAPEGMSASTAPEEHDRARVGETQPAAEAPSPGEEGEEHAVGGETTAPAEGSEPEKAVDAEAEETDETEEGGAEDDKGPKKKKKKERKMQPAQIIGRVELKKPVSEEPPPATSPRPAHPSARRPSGPPARSDRSGPDSSADSGKPGAAREEQPGARRRVMTVVQQDTGGLPSQSDDERRRNKKKKEREKKGRTAPAGDERRADEEKQLVRRRKEVLHKDDLYDERSRPVRLRARGKKPKPRKTEITTPRASKRRIKVGDAVTVSNLAHKMSVKAAEVIQRLLALGTVATMNEVIDYETAALVAAEFGFETESSEAMEMRLLPETREDSVEELSHRSPVVTMMGHVDHGKTSLLDYIRSTHVTGQEAGGITQHIGAYKVGTPKGEVVFLDTPGHEAFTAMRARGAQVTDFVVLVVAADDGVMEQTREAINHAQAAHVPIIIAVNKIDKPDADRDKVVRELSEVGLIPESWGGDTLYAYVSAKTGEGVPELLDLILLQAEMMELKANADKPAVGTIIEARLDKGKGPVATVLIREGTLKVGQAFVAGMYHGKVRAMTDQDGHSLSEAQPVTPVELQGFSGVPEAGEPFTVVDEEKVAKQIGTHRQARQRKEELAVSSTPVSLEDLMARMKGDEIRELNLIVKGDVQGSIEALKESLLNIPSSDIKVKVIHSGVGTVTESDIMLAAASEAIIIGFNVRPDIKTLQLGEEKHVDIRLYTVIYEAIEDVRKAMEGLLPPVEKEIIVGHAEVRDTFSVPKVGIIAGCHVTSGKIQRSNNVRLLRDSAVVFDGKISSMKRFKDDVKEAVEGYECGIGLHNFNDVKVGDVIEAYTVEQERAKLG